jgi:hypothetical protein
MANRSSRGDQRMSPEEQLKFNDRWLKTNATLGSILAIGILAMALAGLNSPGQPNGAIEFSSVTRLSK